MRKLVSVFDYEKQEDEKLTMDHLNLMGYFVTTMVSEYYISEIIGGGLFVQEAKKKTKQYAEFLEQRVTPTFKQTYELNEDNMEAMYLEMKKAVEEVAEKFLVKMCEL